MIEAIKNLGVILARWLSSQGQVFYGQKTVTTGGTDEVLAATQALVVGVTIKALSTNTNSVWVGAEGVAAATGFELAAGEQIFLPVSDLALVWLDVTTDGEGVSYVGN